MRPIFFVLATKKNITKKIISEYCLFKFDNTQILGQNEYVCYSLNGINLPNQAELNQCITKVNLLAKYIYNLILKLKCIARMAILGDRQNLLLYHSSLTDVYTNNTM